MNAVFRCASCLVMICLISASAFGAGISGRVVDSETGHSLAGATIRIDETNLVTTSDAEGRFFFSDVPTGRLTLTVSLIGYEVAKRRVDSGAQAIQMELRPRILPGQDIVVTATRAQSGQTPAAFSNFTRRDIESHYWVQDTPMLLTALPNVFAYSDAGSPIGYSYMKIRGFDQKRISVLLNGIPLNDAESHEVFWIDLPDFLNSTQDIQVQRGVGISLYGPSALGGTVNIITHDFPATPELKVETGYGDYNTRKVSISGNSGLINDSYVFYGRFSKINTDGYRENSWARMFAYFIGLARYGENFTLKFNTYGGPEECHLAYKGISDSVMAVNRRHNEFTYPDEIDHFNQPHYEFFADWNVAPRLSLANTIFYFAGDGYYNQFRQGKDLAEYNLGARYIPGSWTMYADSANTFPSAFYQLRDSLGNPLPDSTGLYPLAVTETDLVKRLTIDEFDWGWLPRLTWQHDRGELIIGAEMRRHQGHHFGEVKWASTYPYGLPPDVRFYDYKVKSHSYTGYTHGTMRLGGGFTLIGNIQYQRHRYRLYDDRICRVHFVRDYDYLSGRGGINYRSQSGFGAFASLSTASRHPALKDIYDPTDYWSTPASPYDRRANFRHLPDNTWEYVGKELKPEKLLDLELGAEFDRLTPEKGWRVSLNLYRMLIRDELVPYLGQLDDLGLPISGNAERTLHQGAEWSFVGAFWKLRIEGNLSVNDDHFVDYVEYDYSGNRLDRSGNRIGGFPEFLGNGRVSFSPTQESRLGVGVRAVGRQYIDNGEQFRLGDFVLVNGDASYDLGRYLGLRSLRLMLRVENMTNRKYVAAGYTEPVGDRLEPRYMVGAERHYFVGVTTLF